MARYDGIAEWYDEQNAEFMAAVTPVIASFLGAGPGRCLEVGCGSGLAYWDRIVVSGLPGQRPLLDLT